MKRVRRPKGLKAIMRTAQVLNENENDDENEKHGFLQIAMLL